MSQNEFEELKKILLSIESEIKELSSKKEKPSLWYEIGYDFLKSFFVVLGLIFIGLTIYGLFGG